MKSHSFPRLLIGMTAVAAIVGVVVIGTTVDAAGPKVTKSAKMRQADDFDPATRVANRAAGALTPLNYVTGFEPEQGFTARGTDCVHDCWGPDSGACGFIGDGTQGDGAYPEPWAVSVGNVTNIEAHIDNVNPFSGSQHLRFQQEPCEGTTPFSFSTDARVPKSPPLPGPIAPATITFQYSVPTGLFGSNMNFQPQANSQGLWTSRLMVFFYGFFYVLEDRGNGFEFIPVYAKWDNFPPYHQVQIIHDPCANFKCLGGPNNQDRCPRGTSDCRLCVGGADDGTRCIGDFQCPDGSCEGGDCLGSVTWTYGGNPVYTGTMMNGTTTEQMLFYTDNFPGTHDIDDLTIETGEPCPTECGNLEIETGEQCDGENTDNCPGHCVPPGQTGPDGEGECTCVIDGGLEPSPLPNGTTTVITHGGWWTWTADAPAYAVDTCGSDYDTAFYVWTGTINTLAFVAINDDCDVNSPYSYGYADPLASCHPVSAPWESCTCVETNIGQDYLVQVFRGGLGDTTNITLTKRLTCGAIWDGGACCDGYGACTEDVLEGDCSAKGDAWTAQKLCATVEPCDIVLGACCDHGPDLDGLCLDGMLADECAGDKQEFFLDAFCANVSCDEVLGACCDDAHGTCRQTLRGACQGSNFVWTQATPCSQVPCDPVPGACLDHKPGDPLSGQCLCTDGVLLAACQGDHLEWVKGAACASIQPNCETEFKAIPTVSEWGLVVLALLLLVSIKLVFRFQRTGERST